MTMIIAIDPGNKKCGLLLADLDGEVVLDARVVESHAVIDLINHWRISGDLSGIILGNGTTSKYWQIKLQPIAHIQVVEERGTTLRARERFWEIWPPPVWMRFLPRGFFVPFQHLDAVAALVLLEDHLNKKLKWSGPTKFRIWPEQ